MRITTIKGLVVWSVFIVLFGTASGDPVWQRTSLCHDAGPSLEGRPGHGDAMYRIPNDAHPGLPVGRNRESELRHAEGFPDRR